MPCLANVVAVATILVVVLVAVAVADSVESPSLMRPAFAFLLCWFLPASALAVGQGEFTVSGGPGLALLLRDETRAGATADIGLLYGLSDSWAARLGVQAAWISASGEKTPSYVTAPTLGLTFAADVLDLVPFADLGLVVADLRGGGGAPCQRLGGQLGLGADYLVSRHLALSLVGRVDYFALRLAGARGSSPVLASFALHLGYLF